jgi:GTP:adenosylcobinamide-phosphate guanylyltransferase
MDAIVTAGGIPKPDEPLYPYTKGGYKALLDIAGKPMIQWILDALCGAQTVDRVIVIGLPPESGVSCTKSVDYLPNQGEMLENIIGGVNRAMALDPKPRHVLLVSSDIPAIQPEIVDWVVNEAMRTDEDVYYNVIPRQVMEARFPNSKRSYTHLKDVEVCGGDMNLLRSTMVTHNQEIWRRLIDSRKNVFKQAALIGYDTLFLLMLRMITMDQAVRTVAKRLKITGRGILCPYAEVGMDVDKPHQLEIMRAFMAQRQTS